MKHKTILKTLYLYYDYDQFLFNRNRSLIRSFWTNVRKISKQSISITYRACMSWATRGCLYISEINYIKRFFVTIKGLHLLFKYYIRLLKLKYRNLKQLDWLGQSLIVHAYDRCWFYSCQCRKRALTHSGTHTESINRRR